MDEICTKLGWMEACWEGHHPAVDGDRCELY